MNKLGKSMHAAVRIIGWRLRKQVL